MTGARRARDNTPPPTEGAAWSYASANDVCGVVLLVFGKTCRQSWAKFHKKKLKLSFSFAFKMQLRLN